MSDHYVQDKEVAGIIENVFSKFKSMLVNKDERSKASLDSQLRKIDQHLADKGHRCCSLERRGGLYSRPVCKNALCGFRSAQLVSEFFRLIVITGKNFRSIGQLGLPNLDPPIFPPPLITPKIKVLKIMPTWVFKQAQRSGKLP